MSPYDPGPVLKRPMKSTPISPDKLKMLSPEKLPALRAKAASPFNSPVNGRGATAQSSARTRPNYAFLSSPMSSRVGASYGVPPPFGDLGKSAVKRRPLTSSQRTDIRPVTDWTWLLSGRDQSFVVQRPWPEYVPESSAAIGRCWAGHNLSDLRESRSSSSRSRK